MNQPISLHIHQLRILKKLTLAPSGLPFSKITLEDISSDHMNYHLKELMKHKLVAKHNEAYHLTDHGKDYSSHLDDEIRKVEKLPKPSVIVWAMRKRKDGTNEYLVNRRLRHPYFGKVGRLTGKVHYGESIEGAALRELREETGLTARFVKLDKIYHKIRRRPDGTTVQDNIFFIFFLTDIKGKMKKETEFQENFWVTIDDVKNRVYDFYDDFVIDDRDKPYDNMMYEESIAIADGY